MTNHPQESPEGAGTDTSICTRCGHQVPVNSPTHVCKGESPEGEALVYGNVCPVCNTPLQIPRATEPPVQTKLAELTLQLAAFLGYQQTYLNEEEDVIEDGFGSVWHRRCPSCLLKTMSVVRPGKVQCDFCDGKGVDWSILAAQPLTPEQVERVREIRARWAAWSGTYRDYDIEFLLSLLPEDRK